MAAQHKRPGATAQAERIQRAKERELARFIRERTIVQFPAGRKKYDGFPGKIMAIGIPPEMDEIA